MKTITVSDEFYERIISEMVEPFIKDLIVNNLTSNGVDYSINAFNSINNSKVSSAPLSASEKSTIKLQCLQFAINQSTVSATNHNEVISKAKLFEQYILGY